MSEHYQKYGKRYYLKNRSEVLERQRRRLEHPEAKAQNKAYHQAWYLANRQRLLDLQKARRLANPLYIKLYHRRWYERNREKKLAQNRDWRHTHLDEQTAFSRRRRIRKLFLGGSHTAAQWRELKALFGFRCAFCGIPESLKRLAGDHKIPVSRGGNDNIDNIQPLCKRCNSSKGTTIWFASRPVDKSWPITKSSMFIPSLQKVAA